MKVNYKMILVWAGLSLSASPLLAEEAGHHHHGAEHKNIIGVFVGATKSENSTDATFGVEYERKLTPQFGLGAAYEVIPDAHEGEGVSIALAAAYWHPHAGWRVGAGIGQETIQGTHSVSNTLTRLTAEYDFHVMGYGVAPTISFDSADGISSQAFGISIGRGF